MGWLAVGSHRQEWRLLRIYVRLGLALHTAGADALLS